MPTEAQIAGGHKANLKHPNPSKESKENSKKILENGFNRGDVSGSKDDSDKDPTDVVGGLKAPVKNPNVSDEAKESAKESAKEHLDNM